MNRDLKRHELYLNREISWLRFNERVLNEARNPSVPLLERLKFLAIFSNNLDEFFSIRVAGLQEQVNAQIYDYSPDGLLPSEQIRKIYLSLAPLLVHQSECLMQDLLPALADNHVRLLDFEALNAEQKASSAQYFRDRIFPLLTPLAIDPSHPIPHLRSLGLNLLVELREPEKNGESRIAVVPLPHNLPRFIPFHEGQDYDFLPIELLIREHLGSLFPKMKIHRVYQFRITRNADLDISEAEAEDLLKLIERELRKRRLGNIVRLEVSESMPQRLIKYLKEEFDLENNDIYRIDGMLSTNSLFQIYQEANLPRLKFAPFTPALNPQVVKFSTIFDAIRQGDLLLHHPYESFNPVVELFKQSAQDPKVLSIKVTLYRTSGRSPIIQALKDAAAQGKQVTVLLELKARFDEEANIIWAKELEQSGVNVVYGMIGLKTHCKMSLVVRDEGDVYRQYIHLSTGNYNEKTAEHYTDLGLLTCNPQLGQDVAELFNVLTGYSRQNQWRKIFVAPINLQASLMAQLDACLRSHSAENPSYLRLVMNSLVDPDMISELYRLSAAGVQIDLCVRGMCCLKPGVPGLSETIRVQSIVGRFLEHSRLFHFHYNRRDYLFAGSADWMQRNLRHRIEIVFPIDGNEAVRKVMSIVDTLFQDNTNCYVLQPDGQYVRKNREREKKLSSQETFMQKSRLQQDSIDTIFLS